MRLAAPAPVRAARLSRPAPRSHFSVPLPAPHAVAPRGGEPLFARPPPLPRTRDPCLMLGLPADATPAAAVAALHVLTLLYHPNNNSDHQAAVQFRALEAACSAVCAGRGSFANPLVGLDDGGGSERNAAPAPPDAIADGANHGIADGAAHSRAARAAAGLVCGACGCGTRRAASAFAAQPAFLCRRCGALNVFAAPGVEVHMHAQQRTAAGVLHFITVDRGCALSSGDAAANDDTFACGVDGDAAAVHVSYPVFNGSRKVVLGPRVAFAPGDDARGETSSDSESDNDAEVEAADEGGAAVPMRARAGCADAARLPPGAPPLVVCLRGDDAGARVFVEARPRGATAKAAPTTWEELRERTPPDRVPSFCAAVLGVAHRGTNEAAALAW